MTKKIRKEPVYMPIDVLKIDGNQRSLLPFPRSVGLLFKPAFDFSIGSLIPISAIMA